MNNIIKVRFNKAGKPHGREYSYLTPVEVSEGDIVEMQTRTSVSEGTVTQINVPESEIKKFKDVIRTIIGKVEEVENEDD